MPDPKDLLIGADGQPRRFGDYLILGLLGEGGMARVYRGQELLSGRPVAIKVLRYEFARSEQGRRQFLTEMGILANIDDPHIVRCLACTEIEQQPVMILEQLEGWTLRQMLDQRVALPWTEAASIAYQIAKALHAAHSRRPPVVHRDLKPENVMCLPDGRVKVMDFGIAKIVETLSGATTHPIGTLQYMSPEHIDAQPVDGRADLFSLGLILWEMLAGRPPFVSDSPRALLEQICTRPTPPLPDHAREGLPPHIEALIGRLLAKRPDERPANAAEVLGLLGPYVGPAAHAARAQVQAHAPTPNRTKLQTSVPPVRSPPVASAAPIATADVVDVARKLPLQRKVEQKFDEAAEAVSRFGRATSALIVRVLVGLMILPAAAVIFAFVPGLLAGLNLWILAEDQDVTMFASDFDKWAMPELLPVLIVCAIVFIRSCWVHHREASEASSIRGWLLLGLVPIAAWVGATGIEFGTDSSLASEVHYAVIAALACWLAITLSWLTGRIASLVLRRLERARA